MQVEAKVEVRPDRFSNCRDALDHGPQFGAVDGVVCGVELRWVSKQVDIELEGREAVIDEASRASGAAVRRARRIVSIAAIGVETNTVAEFASEHAIERLASGFGRQIPQGNLDTAKGNQEDARLTSRKDMETAQLLPAALDIARILANQLSLEFRNKADNRGRPASGLASPYPESPASVSIRTKVALPW
jgi:hypothetical protein